MAGYLARLDRLLAEASQAELEAGAGTRLGTPLHAAAQHGCQAAVQRLLGAGADVNALTRDGCTPLHLAAGNEAVMRCLLAAPGVRVDAEEELGEQPLHWAAEIDHPRTMQLLLDAGAYVNADGCGCTPLQSAVHEGAAAAAAEVLLQAGADRGPPLTAAGRR